MPTRMLTWRSGLPHRSPAAGSRRQRAAWPCGPGPARRPPPSRAFSAFALRPHACLDDHPFRPLIADRWPIWHIHDRADAYACGDGTYAYARLSSGDVYAYAVDRLRAARPDLALSSDFIVGFPGETDADFQATLDLVANVRYAQAFSFKYSPRPGTPAARLAQVAESVKAERLAALQDLLNAQQAAFNATCVGRVVPVLFDGPGRREGQIVGRSPYLQPVHVHAESQRIGSIAPVRIARSLANSLAGELVERQAAA